MFHTPTETKTFCLAGHATVTLRSQKTEKRYTFRINLCKDRETGEPKGLWFVSLLDGPDNENDYQYVGVLDVHGFRTTGKSRFAKDSQVVKGFEYFWRHICADHMPPHMDVFHSGNCGRCGRKLTTPDSVTRGIGPICLAEMGLA